MTTETKAYDGKHVTNTLNGIAIQTALMYGLPIQYPQNSTINENLNINSDVVPGPTERPITKYLVLGNGGHAVTSGDNLATPIALKREPTDVAPANMIPHVLRLVDDDLSDELRELYALRILEEHFGKRYWAYYARRLDFAGINVLRYHTKVQDGQATINQFEYSDLNLRPRNSTMPDYNYEVTDQLVPVDGDYVSASANLPIALNMFDIQELLNVANVLYKDPRKAVISEYCMCSGIDFVTSGESLVGSPFQYTEVKGLMAVTFLTTFTNAAYQNRGIIHDMDIGNAEPMAVAPGQIAQQTGSAVEGASTLLG